MEAVRQIVFGTTNPSKLARIKSLLSDVGIDVIGLEKFGKLPEPIEDGKTVLENARKKAIHYAKMTNSPVLAMDSALYFDDLPEEEQPGVAVRRTDSKRRSDEEMIKYYSKIISKYGEYIYGHWETGIVLADQNGVVDEVLLKPKKRKFMSKASEKRTNGTPMDSLQIDPNTGKYVAEISAEEKDVLWRHGTGEGLKKLFKKYL